ncbi:response regulator transcription factor [Vibrio cincinnatiensis]|uniref:Transcriptional regulatory protein, C terminal n=1 Tax=Vibrio cincinnatiensis DSM 19608 TaxID=1123491 RepID=A0A1T4PCQ9_VIBCI|nr:response regulator transcription factor [Vibrio cincinnatiensis]MCG3758157.1 response regulator transcription factor [Vibrio cincinnatiensis]MCG3761453.1 response regulator transcription factor [Vibrio cincinnatiensis]SJZ89161.1 Transcriptional regulatory protein, C terminal [Vibrio cincinnatiensis DSM 19608]SUP47728.1 transcriptional regulator SyrB [Vibrio cincinnatiensis]
MPTILIADDDPVLCQLLESVLKPEGYQVYCAHDGEQALSLLANTPFDLVLLDVMMPKLNGLQAARRICQRFSTPIIMISAFSDEAAKIEGYEAGADHYLAKPFSIPKLLTLIKASLRRVALEKQRYSHKLSFAPSVGLSHRLDTLRRLPFTQTELDLVTYLAAHSQKVISKAELQHQVLKRELCPFDRNLDMHISNIRRKLSQAGWPKSTIRTARGVGYQFELGHA